MTMEEEGMVYEGTLYRTALDRCGTIQAGLGDKLEEQVSCMTCESGLDLSALYSGNDG
jgi:hypothetical protein